MNTKRNLRRNFEGHERTPSTLGRRAFLGGALAVGALGLVDASSRSTLSSHVSLRTGMGETSLDGERTLSTFTPGIFAQVEPQTRPLMPEAISRGDVLLAESDGALYDGDELAAHLAEKVHDMLRTRAYGRVAMNGISMGGLVAKDASKLLHNNGTFAEYSAEPSLTLFGTPTGAKDLTGANQWLAQLSASIPFGVIANRMTDGINWVPYPNPEDLEPGVDLDAIRRAVDSYNETPLSAFGGQLRSITFADSLMPGELSWLHSAAYVSFNPNSANPVDDAQAAAKWQKSVGPEVPFAVMSATMNHAGFSDQPSESARVMREVYDFHAAN